VTDGQRQQKGEAGNHKSGERFLGREKRGKRKVKIKYCRGSTGKGNKACSIFKVKK